MMATKAIIFARVSSREQENGYSIDAQLNRQQMYCGRHNLTVIKTFELSESSTKGDRRLFMEMIDFVKKQKGTIGIISDKVDRLQRSLKEFPLLDALIENGKIEIHFTTENYFINKNSLSHERFIWSMGVIMAKSYIDSMRDNIKRSVEHKKHLGAWNAIAPIGYLNVMGERGRGDIAIDPDRAPIVKKLFETYATGAFTLAEICQKSAQWGLKNRLRKKEHLTKSQIHKMVINPFYYGQMRIKKELYPHRHERIITKDLFDQCQAVLKGWNKKQFKWGGKEYVFRGLLTCSTTGRVVTADTKKRTLKNGSIGEWTYLRCSKPEDPTKYMWVREEIVLKQAEQILKKLTLPPDMLDDIQAYIRLTHENECEFIERQSKELHREYQTIQNRLDTLINLLMDNVISREEYEAQKKKLRSQQLDIEGQIAANRQGDDGFKKALLSLVFVTSKAHWLFENSTVAQKRVVLNFVFSNLSLKGDKLLFSLRNPLDQFGKNHEIEKWSEIIDNLRNNAAMRKQVLSFNFAILEEAFNISFEK